MSSTKPMTQHLTPPRNQLHIYNKRLSSTLAQSLKRTSQTPFIGGSKRHRHILICHEWHLTSLWYLVSNSILVMFCYWLNISTGTSVDVEHLFSCGHLILLYTWNRLNVTLTQALLCLSSWSLLGLLRDEDLAEVSKFNDIDSKIELEHVSKVL